MLRLVVALLALAAPSLARGALPSGPHPRFLVGRLRPALAAAWKAHRPQVTALVAACDEQEGKAIASGYQGWDWASQMAACAVAWHATGDARRAAQAVTYWKALLDDKDVVGDGLGGLGDAPDGRFIVAQDSGYSMRTYGTFAALGLDWLHDAPGVDRSLRARAIARLDEWGRWYEQGNPRNRAGDAVGYHNDEPAANYFAGYLLATWAAAIAVGADDAAVGARLWARATRLTDGLLVPALRGSLAGGDQPEGWQYGELTTASWALASAAAADNGHAPFANQFLHDTIALHLHALHPGGGEFLDAGDQQNHPVRPASTALWAALVAIPDDPFAPFARRFVASVGDNALPFTQALAEARSPAWPVADWTSAGLPRSFFARGTGLLIARSGWGAGDGWVAMWCGGRQAGDHQHSDAGHFELSRGGDFLALPTADYGTYATWNNNTLLFDDGGANSTYPPQQGAWSPVGEVAVTHFAELGGAVAAQADFAAAYVSNHGSNSVRLARRELVFARPDVVIVNDRDVVARPSVKVTWLLHVPTAPVVQCATVMAEVGGSRLTSRTLLPTAAAPAVVTEPVANAGPGPWRNNDTWKQPLYRVEESVAGATAQRFLHVLAMTGKGESAPPVGLAEVPGAHVVTVGGAPARVVVLPSAPDGADLALPLSYLAPAKGRALHVVFGLAAAPAYRVTLAPSGGRCQVTIAAGAGPRVVSGDRGASFQVDGCALVAP